MTASLSVRACLEASRGSLTHTDSYAHITYKWYAFSDVSLALLHSHKYKHPNERDRLTKYVLFHFPHSPTFLAGPSVLQGDITQRERERKDVHSLFFHI